MIRTSALSFETPAVRQGGLAVIWSMISSQLKKTTSLMMAFLLALVVIITAAQELKADTPTSAYIPLNADQLNQLVAPIALDTDPLIAQILTASTYPDQVAAADTWSNQNMGLSADQRASGADAMAWDAAIKGLVEFPDVLDNLAKNVAWTTQLGNAYFNQPDDVMNAIQALRTQAHESNVLVTTPQQRVVVAANIIEVVPADPAVVYVPYYNPWRIWGTLFVAYPGFIVAPPPVGVVAVSGIAFEPPIAVAAYAGFSWGVSAWTPAWTGGAVLFNHSTYISSSTTVINHGHFGGHDRGVFEHGGHGVPNGYHACAHAGAGRMAAERSRAGGYGHQAHGGYAGGAHSQARNGHSSGNRSKSSNGYKAGTHAQAHNSYGTSARNSSQARNSQSSRTRTRSQARNTSRSGMNHSQARNSNHSSAGHSQARNTARSGMNPSHARSTNRSATNHSQSRSTNRSAASHSQARSNTRSGANRSQARCNTRSSGMNRSQAPRSTGTGNRPQPRTVANRQSAAGRSAGSRASGGKRR
jgi:hypothetical protein